MKSLKLYEIAHNLRSLEEMFENDEIPDDAYHDTLDGIQSDMDERLMACVQVIRNLEASELAIKNEIDRLNKLKRIKNNNVTRVKEYIKHCFDQAGIEKSTAGMWNVRRQKGREFADFDDVNALPDEYTNCETIITADKKKLLADLKSDKLIDGVSIKRGESFIVIR